MKKNPKLFVSILLSLFLLNISFFSSCNSNISPKPSDDTTQENTNKDTTEEPNETTNDSNVDTDDSSNFNQTSESDDNSNDSSDSDQANNSDDNSDNPSDSDQTNNSDNNSNDSSNFDQTSESDNNSDNPSDSDQTNESDDNSEDSLQQTNPVAKDVDCHITATDLGGWTGFITIDAAKFSEMVSGDYITITTITSPTNSAEAQLSLCDGTWTNIGSDGSCTNVSSYNSEYTCYTLNTTSQSTLFTPSDAIIEILKSKGMIIKGQGVKVTAVVIRVNAKLDETDKTDKPEVPTISSNLCDASATENAKHLYKFIKAMYGSKVITGQMENAWDNDYNQLEKVYESTGKYPALMGFDFMDYTGISWDASTFNKQTERAINFWNGKDWNGNKISDNQGIVAFCWHWFDPLHQDYSFKPGDGTDGTTSFRIPYNTETDSWDTTSAAYKAIQNDMDVVAAELLKLQTAGVPVLWRPLHEGAGNVGLYNNTGSAWFWWGAGNSINAADMKNEDLCGKCYIALWKWMYEYFTEVKGIHNLIWVWNGQNAKFYPGSKYVDMIGDDIYYEVSNGDNPAMFSSNKAKFETFQAMDTAKPVAMTECGTLPDIETDGALWSFFMIWNDSSNDKTDAAGNYWNGEYYNTDTRKKSVYSSETAITLDELPDLTEY